MNFKQLHHKLLKPTILSVGVIVLCLLSPHIVRATAPAPQNPQSGSIGLEGTIQGSPPTTPATITTPSNNQSFSTEPITVAGLCKSGLLVKIFDNNVFAGSTQCVNGSFSLKIDLFPGTNNLIARVYDALDQAGPDSNGVAVTFSSSQFISYGTLLSLTSTYAKRGSNPGQQLTWPIIISGGIGPYALSIDWGDSTTPSLLSQAFAGSVDIEHTYNTSGTYTITIQATDKNGETAFLQVVGLVNGPATQSSASSANNGTKTVTKTAWWPVAILLPLIVVSFWLGRRHELFTLRRRLEQSDN